jgi:hypothetical protein
MRTYAKILLGSVAAVAGALAVTDTATSPVQAQTQSGNFCLNVSDIRNTQAVDNRTIVYRMKNGDVWRNTLAAPCPDLVTHAAGAYSQTVHTDEICANTHRITVATGMVCRLGTFARAN